MLNNLSHYSSPVHQNLSHRSHQEAGMLYSPFSIYNCYPYYLRYPYQDHFIKQEVQDNAKLIASKYQRNIREAEFTSTRGVGNTFEHSSSKQFWKPYTDVYKRRHRNESRVQNDRVEIQDLHQPESPSSTFRSSKFLTNEYKQRDHLNKVNTVYQDLRFSIDHIKAKYDTKKRFGVTDYEFYQLSVDSLSRFGTLN